MSIGNITEQALAQILEEKLVDPESSAIARKKLAEEYSAQDWQESMLMGQEAASLARGMRVKTQGRVGEAVTPSATKRLEEITQRIEKQQAKRPGSRAGLGSPPPEFTRGKPSGPTTPQQAYLSIVRDLLTELGQSMDIVSEG